MRLTVISFVFLVLISGISCANCFIPSFDMCSVVRVVDGDTFVADCRFRGKVKVRLLGVDAYETYNNRHLKLQLRNSRIDRVEAVDNGVKAKLLLERFIGNKAILLVFGDRRYDWYGRLLATVYVSRGNRFVDLLELLRPYKKIYFKFE